MEQWLITGHCTYCNAPLYELSTPTCCSWLGTGRYKWGAGDSDCLHSLKEEVNESEISPSANPR